MTTWTPAYVNDLPDSAFVLIAPGGHPDSTGRTVPRELRHFPVRDAAGKLDPEQLGHAAAAIPRTTTLSANLRESATAKLKALAHAAPPRAPELATRSRPVPAVELPEELLGDQFRSFSFPLECRSEGDGRTLLGRAVPYGVTAELGNYAERFIAGAFAKQIASGTVGRVKLYESHQARLSGAPPIGKAAELHERADGLHGAFPMFSTSRADDALQLVNDGEVTGLSVGFRAVPGGSVRGRDGVIERRVVHLDHVVLTHEPAYAEAGVLAVRSVQPASQYRDELAELRARTVG